MKDAFIVIIIDSPPDLVSDLIYHLKLINLNFINILYIYNKLTIKLDCAHHCMMPFRDMLLLFLIFFDLSVNMFQQLLRRSMTVSNIDFELFFSIRYLYFSWRGP